MSDATDGTLAEEEPHQSQQGDGSDSPRPRSPNENRWRSKLATMILGGVVGAGTVFLLLLLSSVFAPFALGALGGPIVGGFYASYHQRNKPGAGKRVGIVSGVLSVLPIGTLVAGLMFLALLGGGDARPAGNPVPTADLVVAFFLSLGVFLIGVAISAVLGLVGGVIGATMSDRPVR